MAAEGAEPRFLMKEEEEEEEEESSEEEEELTPEEQGKHMLLLKMKSCSQNSAVKREVLISVAAVTDVCF